MRKTADFYLHCIPENEKNSVIKIKIATGMFLLRLNLPLIFRKPNYDVIENEIQQMSMTFLILVLSKPHMT